MGSYYERRFTARDAELILNKGLFSEIVSDFLSAENNFPLWPK